MALNIKVFQIKLDTSFGKNINRSHGLYFKVLIDMDEYPEAFLNAFLVSRDVRQAYLLQHIDYGENTIEGETTQRILAMINREFPELKQTPMSQGVLICKIVPPKIKYESDEGLAYLLGFPCVGNKSFPFTYAYHISATFNEKEVDLISYGCYSKTTEKSNILYQKVKTALAEIGVTDVQLKEDELIQVSTLVNMLEQGTPLDKRSMEEMLNYFWNVNLTMEFNKKFSQLYQQENPIHRGIAITLLHLYENDPVEPFYPIQYYPLQKPKIENQMLKLGEAIIESLASTRTSGRNVSNIKTRRRRRAK